MAKPLDDLSSRTVIVTGASSGIGRACALLLGELGASVVLVGRDRARLDATRATIAAAGGIAAAAAGDLADTAFLREIVAVASERSGRIDGLVHNASVIEIELLDAISAEALARQWQVNVVAPLLLTSASLPYMHSGGSIVLVSSTAARVGLGGICGYTATKGAVAAMGRSMADELAARGIRVNTVSPGWVRTPMVTPQFEADPAFEERIRSRSLVGRIGEPEDVASVVAFLLSSSAAYVNGATIVADGGASSSMALSG